MASDPRIQTIGEVPIASGVGEMLFDRMEQTRQDERKLKHAGALAGIESKHRQAEQENANKLAMGMENLRNTLAVQRSQQAFQQEQAVRQQGATYLQGLIGQAGQQGIAMPGLSTPTIGTPEAGIPGTPEVAPIPPGAVDIARDVYSKNVSAHLSEIEKRRGLSMEFEKKQLFEQLDRMTDDDTRDATDLASQFEAHGDKMTANLVQSYARPGEGSRSEWQKFKLTTIPKLMTAQAANQTRLAIAGEVSARAKEVQRLKGETSKLLAAPRLEMAQFKQLQGLHASLSSQLRGYRDMHQRLEARLYVEAGPEAETKIRTQMRQLEMEMQSLQDSMSQVSGRLGAFEPPVTPSGGSPEARPTMPGAPAPAPGTPSGNDPLGVRR